MPPAGKGQDIIIHGLDTQFHGPHPHLHEEFSHPESTASGRVETRMESISPLATSGCSGRRSRSSTGLGRLVKVPP